jgi:hypothetical protein
MYDQNMEKNALIADFGIRAPLMTTFELLLLQI